MELEHTPSFEKFLTGYLSQESKEALLFKSSDSQRDLAIDRVLSQAVEHWIKGDEDKALYLVNLAERYLTDPDSTFEP